jgi:hypothetical protein
MMCCACKSAFFAWQRLTRYARGKPHPHLKALGTSSGFSTTVDGHETCQVSWCTHLTHWYLAVMLGPAIRACKTHLRPAPSAGLGIKRLVRAVHGDYPEGGRGPILALTPQDAAVVHAQRVQQHRRPEVDAAREAFREDITAVEPACLRPAYILYTSITVLEYKGSCSSELVSGVSFSSH